MRSRKRGLGFSGSWRARVGLATYQRRAV
jgi:hypothetical protein